MKKHVIFRFQNGTMIDIIVVILIKQYIIKIKF
jgi:hypothetical protein